MSNLPLRDASLPVSAPRGAAEVGYAATVAGLDMGARVAVEEARQARFQLAAERLARPEGWLRRWLRALRG